MKKDLLLEFEKSFMEWKKEFGFKASLDELDEIFFHKRLYSTYMLCKQ